MGLGRDDDSVVGPTYGLPRTVMISLFELTTANDTEIRGEKKYLFNSPSQGKISSSLSVLRCSVWFRSCLFPRFAKRSTESQDPAVVA